MRKELTEGYSGFQETGKTHNGRPVYLGTRTNSLWVEIRKGGLEMMSSGEIKEMEEQETKRLLEKTA